MDSNKTYSCIDELTEEEAKNVMHFLAKRYANMLEKHLNNSSLVTIDNINFNANAFGQSITISLNIVINYNKCSFIDKRSLYIIDRDGRNCLSFISKRHIFFKNTSYRSAIVKLFDIAKTFAIGILSGLNAVTLFPFIEKDESLDEIRVLSALSFF